MTRHPETIPTWRARCPLRLWRERNGASQGTVALMLEPPVSRQSVANWEEGVADPTKNWMSLAKLMRVGERSLVSRWKRWRDSCPR